MKNFIRLLIAIFFILFIACNQNIKEKSKEDKIKDSIIFDSLERVIKANNKKDLLAADSSLKTGDAFNEINSVIFDYYSGRDFFDNGFTTIENNNLDYAKMYVGIMPINIGKCRLSNNELIIAYFNGNYSILWPYNCVRTKEFVDANYESDKSKGKKLFKILLIYNLKFFSKEYYHKVLKNPFYIKYNGFPEDKFNRWYIALSKNYKELLADSKWQEYLRRKEIENRNK